MNHIRFQCFLDNRALVMAKGGDAAKLLQSLLTCDVDQLAEDALAYGFLLTPQGRFLHELFIIKTPDGFLLDVQAEHSEDFLKRLKMYTLRSEVAYQAMDDWGVLAMDDASFKNTTEHHQTGVDSTAILPFKDPRHDGMGMRLYGALTTLQPLAKDADRAHYDQHRVNLGIPAAEDFVKERTLLLDYNVDKLGGIDFEKGCYVGQEVTARMHYRAIDKKGLYLLTPADAPELRVRRGDPVFANEVEIGHVLSRTDQVALAILRHEQANGIVFANHPQGQPVKTARPSWIHPSPELNQ